MKFKKSIKLEKGKLDITPLIDVVLLLLIFFMLSSSFIVQPGIKVKLPTAVAAKQQEKKNTIISVTKEGFLYINNERVSLQGLENELKKITDNKKQHLLVIRADTNVKHGNVVNIMNTSKKIGFEKIAIATKPEEFKG